MNNFLVYTVIVVCVFGFAFAAKKRLGLAGIALAVGYIISGAWGNTVANFVSKYSPSVVASITNYGIEAIIVILPAILLIVFGDSPKYKSIIWHLVGAIAFTMLASTFIVLIMGDSGSINDGFGAQAYSFIQNNSSVIIVSCLIFSLLDIIAAKVSSKYEASK